MQFCSLERSRVRIRFGLSMFNPCSLCTQVSQWNTCWLVWAAGPRPRWAVPLILGCARPWRWRLPLNVTRDRSHLRRFSLERSDTELTTTTRYLSPCTEERVRHAHTSFKCLISVARKCAKLHQAHGAVIFIYCAIQGLNKHCPRRSDIYLLCFLTMNN